MSISIELYTKEVLLRSTTGLQAIEDYCLSITAQSLNERRKAWVQEENEWRRILRWVVPWIKDVKPEDFQVKKLSSIEYFLEYGEGATTYWEEMDRKALVRIRRAAELAMDCGSLVMGLTVEQAAVLQKWYVKSKN